MVYERTPNAIWTETRLWDSEGKKKTKNKTALAENRTERAREREETKQNKKMRHKMSKRLGGRGLCLGK